MRKITPQLPQDLEKWFGRDVAKAEPYSVSTYRELVTHVAHLAHANPDHLLFFRGQGIDFKKRGGASTFYPSIYRTDPLPKDEIASRFQRLKFQGTQLAQAFQQHGLSGADELEARELLQWSVIQHYGVGLTPLLDVTHSLMVACSFAQKKTKEGGAYVYAFGFPHISNRISVNSEHDIINIRLLSICPPDALRPYFHEGYLVGTWDVTDTYQDKSDLDFNRRLVGKFKIPQSGKFWGAGFDRIPEEVLYPENDKVKRLCESIKKSAKREVGPHNIGLFLLAWQDIERMLLSVAGKRTARMINLKRAIDLLSQEDILPKQLTAEINKLRKWRNKIVHEAYLLAPYQLEKLLDRAQTLSEDLGEVLNEQ